MNLDPHAAQRLPSRVTSIHCNRRDYAAVRAALAGKRFEAVLDIVYAPTTVEDVAAMLEAVGPDIRRYVFSSSSSVYKRTDIYPITEDHPRAGNQLDGGYTQHKFDCENYLFQEHERRGAPIAIVRPRHIYGPRNPTYREGFLFDRLLRGRPILIPGDGSLLNQNGYVDDIAEGFRLAMEREEAVGQAYTVTGRESVTLSAHLDLLAKVAGRETRKVFYDVRLMDRFEKPFETFGEHERFDDGFGEHERFDDGHAIFDLTKARDDLGYIPKVSLEEGLRRSFEHHQQTGGGDYRRRLLDFSLEDELIGLAERSDASLRALA
jgi:nucleoside-diphosphate-sugar epimerase